MTYKGIICTDLDGTLLFRNDEDKKPYMKQCDIDALHQLRQSGYLIAIATGREVMGIRSFLQQSFVAFDYYVGGNGAIILDQHFQELLKCELPKSVMIDILKYVKVNYPMMGFMGTDGWKRYFFGAQFENAQVNGYFNPERDVHYSIEEYEQSDIELIMFNISPAETYTEDKFLCVQELEIDLQAKYGNQINMFRNQYFLDFAQKGVSKGTAVEYLSKLTTIPMGQVYVIGDSWNDVSMFQTKAQSYSFNHAEDGVKKHVHKVVKTFAEMVEDIHLLDK